MTLPQSGGVVSVGLQRECTGATGAQATCIDVIVQSDGGGNRVERTDVLRCAAASRHDYERWCAVCGHISLEHDCFCVWVGIYCDIEYVEVLH